MPLAGLLLAAGLLEPSRLPRLDALPIPLETLRVRPPLGVRAGDVRLTSSRTGDQPRPRATGLAHSPGPVGLSSCRRSVSHIASRSSPRTSAAVSCWCVSLHSSPSREHSSVSSLFALSSCRLSRSRAAVGAFSCSSSATSLKCLISLLRRPFSAISFWLTSIETALRMWLSSDGEGALLRAPVPSLRSAGADLDLTMS